MRLGIYLDHGWFALDWSIDSGGSSAGDSNTLVYGPVAMLLLHGLTVAVGVAGWDVVATTPEAYAARHLGVVLIGLVGTAAAAGTTRFLLGSWRWALVTAAALLALPMWTGHAMFNIKDVPVATGYTPDDPGPGRDGLPPSRGAPAARVAALAAGIVLMVGTRPAMVGAVLVARRRPRLRRRRGRATGTGVRPAVPEVATGRVAGRRSSSSRSTPGLRTPAAPGAVGPAVRELPRRRGRHYLYVPFYLGRPVPAAAPGLFARRPGVGRSRSSRGGGVSTPRRPSGSRSSSHRWRRSRSSRC